MYGENINIDDLIAHELPFERIDRGLRSDAPG